MKEIRNASKNKWTRMFRKKWFFPALYIIIAAFLLTGVVWYQSLESNLIEGLDDQENSSRETNEHPNQFEEEDAQSVLQQEEVIRMPVSDEVQTEIVTKFYDYNAKQEDQEKGLTLYNNRYYQSTGVEIASADGETFDVIASLSGTVTEVKEDPLYGNVVTMSHGDDITTYYASLGEVNVETGTKVKQGEKIGTAGKNLFSEESGTHVHFELQKGDTEVNPEDFFNEPLTKLEQLNVEAEMDEPSSNEDENSDDEDEENSEDEEENSEMQDTETNKDLSLSFPV